jgi:K+-sensing histidine kinase KdpD
MRSNVMSVRMLSGRHYSLVLAFIGPLIAAAVMVVGRTRIQTTELALVMVVVVALVVLPGRRIAAAVAGLSAGLWFDFFLTKPYESFSIQQTTDVQTTVLLTVVAVVVGEVAARRLRARRDGARAKDEAFAIHRITQMLSAGRSLPEITGAVADEMRALLLLSACRYDPEPNESRAPVLDRSGELQYGLLNWPLESEGFPNRDVMLPVECRGRRYGSFVLRGPSLGVPLTQDRRLAAIVLSDVVGAAASLDAATVAAGPVRGRGPSSWSR